MPNSTLVKVAGTDPAYTGLLGELRKATSRVEAARLTVELASVADDLSAALLEVGYDEADEGTSGDPIAWKDINTHLIRISLALSFGTFDTADCDDLDDTAEWNLLSEADDRAEFAAAWEPIKEQLTARTVPAEGEDKPELREFAVAQVLAVADAVINACW